eukprot:SAG11_NODE_18238_length_496_cov_1.433249_1_plen_99_part_01
MVMKIQDNSKATKGWTGCSEEQPSTSDLSSKMGVAFASAAFASAAQKHTETVERRKGAKRNWNSLGSRLRALVNMKRQWGELHDIYETRAESLFEVTKL